ncbi:hypothetical protein DTL21_00110 [Bremerella cremea]|uniref:Uncharacterized protein n=1 Tax=Blastopirellula marina TaxID=124 RepID=A0A2S8G7X9_9BACT|nr:MULTISPECIES: hypothetical protein [Pirellulaceae]PQO40381.1 hypothetical protein C5Y83_00110 [Blastopirellula marina]RCS51963.1 hypothetical protein DTL21_00110 [Bremerella cremea]
MKQDNLKQLQAEWLQVKEQLETLQALEAQDDDSADQEASLSQRLDELEFEIALQQRGGGPCSLM